MVRKHGRAGKIWVDDDLAMIASRSVLPVVGFLSDASPGDVYHYPVPIDCKVVGIQFYQAGDEGGTNGVVEVEVWDDATGSGSQNSLTGAFTIDGAGANVETVTLTSTEADLYITAGESIALKVTTAATNSVQCYFTILIETVELVKY